jgi:NAD-dependent dihydropyrimidine dehydrogenase PreA subunit
VNGKTYKGIPRKKIPWYPIIDHEKCVNCRKCVEYCKFGAYELEETEGNKRTVVKNPYKCVVLCTGCEEQCPTGAITHPSKIKTRKIIAKLLNAKSV